MKSKLTKLLARAAAECVTSPGFDGEKLPWEWCGIVCG